MCIPEEHSSDEEDSDCSSVHSEVSEKENIPLSTNRIDTSESRTISTVRTVRSSSTVTSSDTGFRNKKKKAGNENYLNNNNQWLKRRKEGVLQE